MDTQTVLALADALRRHALRMGSDLNASNYYAHSVLMRMIAAQRGGAVDADALWAILEHAKGGVANEGGLEDCGRWAGRGGLEHLRAAR